MNALRVPLRVVFYEEDGEWVAHCLARFAAGHDVAEYELSISWLSPDVVIERADVREFRENWDSPQSVPGDLVSA